MESDEGINKAGGFGVSVSFCIRLQDGHLCLLSLTNTMQGLGAILVSETFGDYHNCVGFPTGVFWRWMNRLATEGVFSKTD